MILFERTLEIEEDPMNIKKTVFLFIAACTLFYGHVVANDFLPEDEACGDDGLCIIFSVMVELDSIAPTPIENNQIGEIVMHGNSSFYKSHINKSGNKCQKHVRVPKPIYKSVVDLMDGLSGKNGPANPTFTPAQQTIMLFYTTIMKQTLQFSCTKSDLVSEVDATITIEED